PSIDPVSAVPPVQTAMISLAPQTSIRDVLASIQSECKANITHLTRIPAQPARFAPMPAEISAELSDVLRQSGIEQLYTHQAQAVGASLGGENVVIVTPTASGKTLCYNLPVLQRLINRPESRALYLFPTKALAHDQYGGLYDFARGLKRD